MGDDFTRPFLTIRYVVEDDTFAVVDTAQHGKVVQGGFKTSGDAQQFAEVRSAWRYHADQAADLKDLSAGGDKKREVPCVLKENPKLTAPSANGCAPIVSPSV